MQSISSLSQASPVLLGLALLSTKSDYDGTSAPVRTPENAPTTSSAGFEPRSTQRAKQRAEFDQRRAVNEQRRIEEEIKGREERVKVIHKELDTLREVIWFLFDVLINKLHIGKVGVGGYSSDNIVNDFTTIISALCSLQLGVQLVRNATEKRH